MDREAKARAISDEAKRARKPISRSVWAAAIVVAVVCDGALVVGWGLSGDRTEEKPAARGLRLPAAGEKTVIGGTGFGAGLAIGGVVGIVLGIAIARRKDLVSGPQA